MSSSAYDKALRLLAGREHSRLELSRKLHRAGFDEDERHTALQQLETLGLQSDARFAESFVRARSQRGYGEVRIRMELQERGVTDELVTDSLNEAGIDWFALAREVRCKRFGEQEPENFKDRAKQQRFLQYRGFTHEQITESFKNPQ